MKERKGTSKGKAGAGVLDRESQTIRYVHAKKLNVRFQQRHSRLLFFIILLLRVRNSVGIHKFLFIYYKDSESIFVKNVYIFLIIQV